MDNTAEANKANDYKVVSFHNAESFDFTHGMGCMYDGRPITGGEGAQGLAAGETKLLPYHVGKQLAKNLAKQSMLKNAGSAVQKDEHGNPMTKAIWDDAALERLANSYITEMYSEDKPAAKSQTDVLFERIAKLEALVADKADEPAPTVKEEPVVAAAPAAPTAAPVAETTVAGFKDKQEVLAELEKRGIAHDKRASKEKLEELLK